MTRQEQRPVSAAAEGDVNDVLGKTVCTWQAVAPFSSILPHLDFPFEPLRLVLGPLQPLSSRKNPPTHRTHIMRALVRGDFPIRPAGQAPRPESMLRPKSDDSHRRG